MSRILRVCGMLVLGLVFAAAKPLTAQETHEMSADEQAMMQKWMAYATPGEPHKHLADMAGEWEWTSSWWMKPGAPPETSSGTSESEMVMGGRYLSEFIHGNMMGQPFEGHSLTGYDNNRKEYFSFWVDNMGTGHMVSRGQYDAAAKRMEMSGTYDDVADGKTKTMRTVTTHQDDGSVRMEMYAEGPDGKEFKTMEIVSKRKGT